MKRYIYTSNNMYNSRLPEEAQLPRLNIKVAEVKPHILDSVRPEDKEIMQYLIDSKVIPTCASSHDLRNNPYYDMEDKFIKLSKQTSESRTYGVPYSGGGRFGSGDIYENFITIYDDGTIKIGRGKIRDPYKYSPSTLKKEFFSWW